ncbi:MAG: DNA topoisomerase VI subunit B [Candidatus Nitrosoabyssus spongiisocia]|nr:MAG: DNA topoisomerase VI subunit B [Nitrosopumilaceae archaeon AB1(1)]
MVNKENFNQISPSEFFYRNRDLAGFSNPARSLYTAVREFVENGLDACDQHNILPKIHISIKAVDPEKNDPKQYILTVKDNGPGMNSKHIPLAFGTVLYGSKFGLKQARGMFGLGATMAILYAQITTNQPVKITSSTDGEIRDEYELLIDIQKNKPVVLKHTTSPHKSSGLSVSICLDGDYSKAGTKIRDYIYQTSLITPYSTITFDDPKNSKFSYDRIVTTMPTPPTIINPHPYGVDVETMRRMIALSTFELPEFNSSLIKQIKSEINLDNKTRDTKKILLKAKKSWRKLSTPTKMALSILSFLDIKLDDLDGIRIEDIDVSAKQLHYWDGAKSVNMLLDTTSKYYSDLVKMSQGETLTVFLTKRFQRIGKITAQNLSEFAGFKPEKRVGTLTNQDIVQFCNALQKFNFLPPDPTCLAPLGEDSLNVGINKFFKPDFSTVIQRNASAYSGFPFVIEIGIAYGGDIPHDGIKLFRFANRIPLLYDEGSDVVSKVISDIDWTRYKIKGEAPMVIVSHICSTRVPYKTVGKENVADRPEIEREIKLALQFLSRKMASYMSKRGRADMVKKRVNLYQKYLPLISQFCTELAGVKKEPNYKNMLELVAREANHDTEKTSE